MSDSLWPHGLVHGILQARILEWVAFPFSREIFPTQGSNPGLLHFRQTLYQLSHKRSPRILKWVSLLQGIFPTQESNWGLLHCKWILYQMSYQGNPSISSVQFSRSVMSDSLPPHESQHTRPLCPSPTPRVHSNSRPLSRWCHPAISSSVIPFSSCP